MRGRGIVWFYSEAMLFSVYRIRYDEILTIRFLFLGRSQQISRFVFKTVIAAKDYLILSFLQWKNHFSVRNFVRYGFRCLAISFPFR